MSSTLVPHGAHPKPNTWTSGRGLYGETLKATGYLFAFAINSLILFYLKGREIAHLYAGSFPIWLQPRPYLGPNQAKLRSQELSPSFPHRMAEIQVFSHSPLP